MPTTIIFPRCYSFGTVDPRTLTTYQNLAVNQTVTTLTDDEDGTPDGIIALNATMSWSAASDAQLVGVTDAGYPVIEDTGFFYILTNQDNLDLTPLIIDTDGFNSGVTTGAVAEDGAQSPTRTLAADTPSCAAQTATPILNYQRISQVMRADLFMFEA